MNQNIILAYDAMNRLTNWTDTYTQTPAAGTTINTTATAAYTWDNNANRQSSLLSQSSRVNTQAATTTKNTQALSYGAGNRLTQNATTKVVGTVSNSTNQAITLDAAGNITNDGIRKYSYTAGNQLSSILVNNITTQYTYDINNRRVSKVSGTNSTAYTYAEDIGDGSTALSATSLLGEYTAIATKEYIYLGDTPIAVVQAGNILTVQTDHLDTPRQLTDNTKKVVWNWAYSAFGENQPTNTNNTVFNLRYPGQYYDAESKLHYNINRYYDPATGRYTQSDPIGLAGGINTYTYVGGNSIRWSDPEGLWDTGDLPQFPQGGVDFSAGFGDSISLGVTSAIRSSLGTDSVVNKNSGAYTSGVVTSFGLGISRLAYAGTAKVASKIYLSSGATVKNAMAASAFRNTLKQTFRGNPWSTFRVYTFEQMLAKYGTAQKIIEATGRTNTTINSFAGILSVGSGLILSGQSCKK
jgi:RHS repeat-associated protein